jgi:small subunit ribosomal protein S8
MDLLEQAINIIKVHRRVGKEECKVPASKVISAVLKIMQREEYLKEFEFVDDGKSGYFLVRGIGAINDCGVITPRFAVKIGDLIDWEQRYLPSKEFGVLIISTPKGMMTNSDARAAGVGGRLLAYVY